MRNTAQEKHQERHFKNKELEFQLQNKRKNRPKMDFKYEKNKSLRICKG
jgi:hypothetical protein